jgi:hypothetical protein
VSGKDRGAFVVLSLAIALTASNAYAGEPPSLERIQELLGVADFETAEQLGQERLASGTLTRTDAARTYLELGIIATARRDPAGAALAFRRALRLEPTLRLPSTAGPDVVAAFSRLISQTPPEPVKVSVRLEELADGRSLEISADAGGHTDGLTRSLLIEGGGLLRQRDLSEEPVRFIEDIPPLVECVTISASVLDEHQNRLWPHVAQIRVCPRASARAAAADAAKTEQRPNTTLKAPTPPVVSRPIPVYVWIGATVTGGLAAMTTVLGVAALDKRDEYHQVRNDPDRNLQGKAVLRDRAIAAENLATASGIAAGSAAVATLVLYLTRPRVAARPEAFLTLNATVPGLSLSGHF